MKNKCLNCGLVNFAGDDVCARCGHILNATQSPKDEKKKVCLWLPLISFNGFGIVLFDQKQLDEELYSATRWIALCCLPIIPLTTIVFSPVEFEDDGVQYTLNLNIYESRPPEILSILKMYLLTLIAVAPVPVALKTAPFARAHLGVLISGLILVGSVVWALLVIIKMQNDKIDYYSYKKQRQPRTN